MCECFEKMLEHGYAEKRSYYDEEKHDFVETGEYIIRLPRKQYVKINNCPICGEILTGGE